ncbi:MAG: alpha/beta fold hydrolase [Betaproteobacteria bacterium]|nr:alpha/beta fold hydrolase [Betaproteobacteria bacterium]
MQENIIVFASGELPQVDTQSSAGVCYLEHQGARLAFDFEGARDGLRVTQLLVLVNGFARPRTDFRAFRKRIHAQMPHLATLALDNRGAGETEGGLDALSVERMAQDAAFLAQAHAQALGLSRYHALGISMGGMICQNWTSRDPHVRSLILVSTTPGGDARVWPEGVESDKIKSKAFEPWPQDSETMHRRMSRYFGPKFRKSSPLLIEMMVKNMLKANAEPLSQGRSRAQYDATIGYDGTRLLSQVTCPTLVLTGSEDEIIPPGNADALCRLIPQAKKVVFPDMGHLLLIEDPENFVAQVRTFLEGVDD